MDVSGFKDDVVRIFQKEGITPESIAKAGLPQDVAVQKVAQEVIDTVVKKVSWAVEQPMISYVPCQAKFDVFKKCLAIMQGEKCESLVVEIAKLIAQNDGPATAENIKNFGIDPANQGALIDIAKLCAKQNGGVTVYLIQNFGVTDQNALIEIAKLCAEQAGTVTALSIKNFGIRDQKALLEIGVYCALRSTRYFKEELGVQDLFSCFPNAVQKVLRDIYKEALQDEFLERCPQGLEELWKSITQHSTYKVNREMLVSFLFACKTLNKMEALKSPRVAQLLEALLAFRTPSLKPFMLESLLDIIVHDKIDQFDTFIKDNLIVIPGKTQNKPLALMAILTVFSMQSLEPSLKTTIVKDYLKFLGTRSSFLALAAKTAAFIEFVRMLNDKVPAEKQKVCKQFLSYKSSDEFSRKLIIFQAAVILGIDIVGKEFEDVNKLVHQEVAFPEGFEKIFETLRRPESLFVYPTRINLLPDSDKTKVKATFTTYLQEVKEGTFTERRYALSPQLIQIRKRYGEEKWGSLIEKWKQQRLCKIEELCNNLKGLLEISKSPLDAFEGYTVVNTDDHWDLFLCGTEVVGSCQRVDGDPQLNKNLLGYVVDGKVRMIAVKDPTGRIVARSIIKLLWEVAQEKPVLLMERVYSNHSVLDPVVEQMAKDEAERLGLELVNAETAQGRHFLSYPNRSGFEYEDSKDVVEQVLE